jgi:hypothetical protein
VSRRVPARLDGYLARHARAALLWDVRALVSRLYAAGRGRRVVAALRVLRAAREALDAHRAGWRTRANDAAIRVASHRRGEPPVVWREAKIGGRVVRVGRARHEHEHWRRAPLLAGRDDDDGPRGPLLVGRRGNPEVRICAAAHADLRAVAGLSVRDARLLVRAFLA